MARDSTSGRMAACMWVSTNTIKNTASGHIPGQTDENIQDSGKTANGTVAVKSSLSTGLKERAVGSRTEE